MVFELEWLINPTPDWLSIRRTGFVLGRELNNPDHKTEDKAMFYRQERMVCKRWDKAKFEPSSGLLGINPYYWLTWVFPSKF